MEDSLRFKGKALVSLPLDTPIEAIAGVRVGHKWGRKVALGALGLAGLLLGGFPLWAARRVIYPFGPRSIPDSRDGSMYIERDVVLEWVEFEARDGKRLSGWFVPAPDAGRKPSPCILLVYGYGGYKEQMSGYAQMLYDAGFSSFMFDMQGSGLRHGAPVTLGYKERWDLMDAVRYVRTRPDVDGERLGVLGVSMGAATALLAAEEDEHIKAIVADSAYANLTDMVRPGLRAFVGSPALIFAPLILRYAEAMLGMKSSDVQPESAAARLGDRPLFVIHGADDSLTSPESAKRIYAAASGPKELWMIPHCGHSLGPVVAPDEYKRRVAEFFRRALGS